MYKIPYPKLTKSVGKEYHVVKRGREYNDCGEEYKVEWAAISSSLFWGTVYRYSKNGIGEEYQVVGNFTQPSCLLRKCVYKVDFKFKGPDPKNCMDPDPHPRSAGN